MIIYSDFWGAFALPFSKRSNYSSFMLVELNSFWMYLEGSRVFFCSTYYLPWKESGFPRLYRIRLKAWLASAGLCLALFLIPSATHAAGFMSMNLLKIQGLICFCKVLSSSVLISSATRAALFMSMNLLQLGSSLSAPRLFPIFKNFNQCSRGKEAE